MNVAICATKNRAQYLPLAILSFFKQTVAHKRLIVFDNGSYSVEAVVQTALERFSDGSADVDYCRQTKDSQGRSFIHGTAMNRCCSLAAPGDVLFVWDDDDWSAPTRMERQLENLKGYGLTGTDQMLFYEEGRNRGFHYRFIGTGGYALGTSQCFTYDFWSYNPFPELAMGADTAFCTMARNQGRLHSVTALDMMVVRGHHDSTSPQNFNRQNFKPYPLEQFPKQFLADRELAK